MPPTPKRRRFAYSLRTLFVVVTVTASLLGWIAYNLKWIQERRNLAVIGKPPWDVPRLVVGSDEGTAPGFLWLFGDRGHDRIRVFFPDEADEDRLSDDQRNLLERIRHIFPEASVTVMPPFPRTSINDP